MAFGNRRWMVDIFLMEPWSAAPQQQDNEPVDGGGVSRSRLKSEGGAADGGGVHKLVKMKQKENKNK